MQELEKILKELEKFTFEAEVYNGDFEGADIDNLLCLGDVRDVLRNHMNNEWIPVEERLPEEGQEVWISVKTDRLPPFLLFPADAGPWKRRSRSNPGGTNRTPWKAVRSACSRPSF